MSKSYLHQLIYTPDEKLPVKLADENRSPRDIFVDVYYKRSESRDGYGNHRLAGPPRMIRGNARLGKELLAELAKDALYGVPEKFLDERAPYDPFRRALDNGLGSFDYSAGARKERYTVHVGGAMSGKTVFAAHKMVSKLARNKIVCIRKRREDLRHSVFAAIKDVIVNDDGFREKVTIHDSDMRFSSREPFGEIRCLGMDQVEELRAQNPNHIWVEEASELTEDDFKMLDLRVRGSGERQITYTFNPTPASKSLFSYLDIDVKTLTQFIRRWHEWKDKDIYYNHTTHMDNRYLSDDARERLESLPVGPERSIYTDGMLPYEELA